MNPSEDQKKKKKKRSSRKIWSSRKSSKGQKKVFTPKVEKFLSPKSSAQMQTIVKLLGDIYYIPPGSELLFLASSLVSSTPPLLLTMAKWIELLLKRSMFTADPAPRGAYRGRAPPTWLLVPPQARTVPRKN